MKIDLEPQDIQMIAEKVVELLTPRLNINNQPEETFHKKALADYIQVNVSWIDKNLHIIPHFKLGKYVRFRRSHIDKWVEGITRPKNRKR